MRKFKPMPFLIFLHLLALFSVGWLISTHKKHVPIGREEIVVIPIEGMITMSQESPLSQLSVDETAQLINELREDEHVRALVLRINSPGGSVGAVQEITSSLKKFRAKGKYVVSSFGDVAASGGYYIACAGDKIFSQPGTLTGSIGVIMQLPNVQGLLGKIGVSMQTIKSGFMKDAGSPYRTMSDDEKRYFTTVIQDAYEQFFETVKSGRNLEEPILRPLADGRIFSGKMAHKSRLVDSLGDLEDAIEEAKKLSGLEGKNPKIIYHKQKPSLSRLLNLLGESPLSNLTKSTPTKASVYYLLQ